VREPDQGKGGRTGEGEKRFPPKDACAPPPRRNILVFGRVVDPNCEKMDEEEGRRCRGRIRLVEIGQIANRALNKRSRCGIFLEGEKKRQEEQPMRGENG